MKERSGRNREDVLEAQHQGLVENTCVRGEACNDVNNVCTWTRQVESRFSFSLAWLLGESSVSGHPAAQGCLWFL